MFLGPDAAVTEERGSSMVKLGDWLSEGWALIKDDIVTFAVASLVAAFVGLVTLGICAPALEAGLFMMMFAKMRGEPVAVGDVFDGLCKFGPAILLTIIVVVAACLAGALLSLIPVVGQIVGLVLGFVIGGALFYSMPMIAATDVSAVDSIKLSWQRVQPNFVMYCVTYFVYCLISSLGSIACLIGFFVTQPLTMAAIAVAYRESFGLPAPAAVQSTPSSVSSEDSVLAMLRRAIATKPNVDERDAEGRTLLFSAAANGHARVAAFLLDNGADVNASDREGSTPLHFAATEGHAHVVKLLIDRGADINAEGPMGMTPTFCAATYGHTDAWGVLRAHGGQ